MLYIAYPLTNTVVRLWDFHQHFYFTIVSYRGVLNLNNKSIIVRKNLFNGETKMFLTTNSYARWCFHKKKNNDMNKILFIQ